MRDLVHLRPIGVSVIVAFLLVGCGSSDQAAETDAGLAHAPYQGTDGADGGLEGSLQRQVDCTTIETADGEMWVPIFPNDGVRWRGEELDVSSTSSKQVSVRDGDAIFVGGGEGDPPDDAVIPQGCKVHSKFWLVTPG